MIECALEITRASKRVTEKVKERHVLGERAPLRQNMCNSSMVESAIARLLHTATKVQSRTNIQTNTHTQTHKETNLGAIRRRRRK